MKRSTRSFSIKVLCLKSIVKKEQKIKRLKRREQKITGEQNNKKSRVMSNKKTERHCLTIQNWRAVEQTKKETERYCITKPKKLIGTERPAAETCRSCGRLWDGTAAALSSPAHLQPGPGSGILSDGELLPWMDGRQAAHGRGWAQWAEAHYFVSTSYFLRAIQLSARGICSSGAEVRCTVEKYEKRPFFEQEILEKGEAFPCLTFPFFHS